MSRRTFAFAAVILAAMAATGVGHGVAIGNGGLVAWGCLFAGCSLALFLASRELFNGPEHWSIRVMALSYVGGAGVALYVILAWALWALEAPMAIGTVRDGRMGEHYWLGPAVLCYAIFCYALLGHFRKQTPCTKAK